MSCPTIEHWNAVGRVLRYIKGTVDYALVLGGNLELVCYTDSAHGDDKDTGRSTGGHLFFLGNTVLVWSSKRQTLVTLSSSEAEYVQASEAAREVIWLAGLLRDAGIEVGPILLKGDNTAAIALAKTSQIHPRTKHICLRSHFIRECVTNKILKFEHIPGEEMVADGLTKSLPRDAFAHFVKHLGFAIPNAVTS